MNREQRRELKKHAKSYIEKCRDYLLIYIDKAGNLQYCSDLNSITEDEKKQTIFEKAIIGMWKDTHNLINGMRNVIRKMANEVQQSDKVQEMKDARSEQLKNASAEENTETPQQKEDCQESERV